MLLVSNVVLDVEDLDIKLDVLHCWSSIAGRSSLLTV